MLVLVMLVLAVACDKSEDKNNNEEKSATELLWENATYKEDTTLGSGSKTVYVTVVALEKSIKVTLKTDKSNLAEALLESSLAEGDVSEYGLYIKKVNGITADYAVNKSYWSFCQNGEALMYGVSSAEISGGESYELVYTK